MISAILCMFAVSGVAFVLFMLVLIGGKEAGE